MALNGNTTLLKVEGEIVASQRNVTFSENRDTIDVTTKTGDGSPANSAFLAGRYSATATLSSLYVYSDTAFDAIEARMRNGLAVTLIRQNDSASSGTVANFEEAQAFITSLSTDFPADGPAEAEASFQITGTWDAM